MEIGMKIKDLRIKKNIPVSEIASKMNVTPQAIYNYEQGKNKPNIDVLKKYSEILNVELNELLDIETNHFVDREPLNGLSTNFYKNLFEAEKQKTQILEKEIDYLREKLDQVLVKY